MLSSDIDILSQPALLGRTPAVGRRLPCAKKSMSAFGMSVIVPLGSPTSVTGIGMKLRALRSIAMLLSVNVRVSTKVDAETGADGAGAVGGAAAGGVAGRRRRRAG